MNNTRSPRNRYWLAPFCQRSGPAPRTPTAGLPELFIDRRVRVCPGSAVPCSSDGDTPGVGRKVSSFPFRQSGTTSDTGEMSRSDFRHHRPNREYDQCQMGYRAKCEDTSVSLAAGITRFGDLFQARTENRSFEGPIDEDHTDSDQHKSRSPAECVRSQNQRHTRKNQKGNGSSEELASQRLLQFGDAGHARASGELSKGQGGEQPAPDPCSGSKNVDRQKQFSHER